MWQWSSAVQDSVEMKKFLGRVIVWPLGAVAVVFLVANRQEVVLSLDPFNASNPAIATAPMPLWVWLSLALLFGFFLGVIGMWRSGGTKRRELSVLQRENAALRKDQREAPSIATERQMNSLSDPEEI